MNPAQNFHPYRLHDCFLVPLLFMFIPDTLYLIRIFSAARFWLEDLSDFFLIIELQYVTTFAEGIMFGICLAPFFWISNRFFTARSANIVFNIALIALAVILIRKLLLFNQLVPIVSIMVYAKWTVIVGAGIALLAFAIKSMKKVLKETLSVNIIAKRGLPLAYMTFFVMLLSSIIFFFQNITSPWAAQAETVQTSNGTEVQPQKESPLIIFLVYDSLAASHTNFEDYPRNTTPNLEKFAEGANYYQNHFSSGTPTQPNSATLMTGKNILHHRIFYNKSLIPDKQIDENIFKITKGIGYKNIFYSHIASVETFAYQMRKSIQLIKTSWELRDYVTLFWEPFLYNGFFDEHLQVRDKFWPNSTFLTPIATRWAKWKSRYQNELIAGNPYINEIVHDWFYEQINQLQSATFFYLHLAPPHPPFHYSKKFDDKFDKEPVPYKVHPTRPPGKEQKGIFSDKERETFKPLPYDRHLFETDQKFGQFIYELKRRGVYDKALIVLTSDHGVVFSGGQKSDGTVPYSERIKIPLIIKLPEQEKGQRFTAFTSHTDIVPSLLSYLGQEIPDWVDGEPLPGFDNYKESKEPRTVFSISVHRDIPWEKLKTPVASLIQDPYHLIYYYHSGEFELYNIKQDKDETEDIGGKFPEISERMIKKTLGIIAGYDSKYATGERPVR